MRRKLFTLCSAVSLLLCAAVCALWARSYRKHDWVRYQREDAAHYSHGQWQFFRQLGYELHSSRGRLECFAYRRSLTPAAGFEPATLDWWERGRGWTIRSDAYRGRPLYVGSGGAGVVFRTSETSLLFVSHLWLAAALLAPPAAWVFVAWRANRQVTPGRCPACGYDLRATRDRCPECGTDVGELGSTELAEVSRAAKAEEIEPRRHDDTKR